MAIGVEVTSDKLQRDLNNALLLTIYYQIPAGNYLFPIYMHEMWDSRVQIMKMPSKGLGFMKPQLRGQVQIKENVEGKGQRAGIVLDSGSAIKHVVWRVDAPSLSKPEYVAQSKGTMEDASTALLHTNVVSFDVLAHYNVLHPHAYSCSVLGAYDITICPRGFHRSLS